MCSTLSHCKKKRVQTVSHEQTYREAKFNADIRSLIGSRSFFAILTSLLVFIVFSHLTVSPRWYAKHYFIIMGHSGKSVVLQEKVFGFLPPISSQDYLDHLPMEEKQRYEGKLQVLGTNSAPAGLSKFL